MQELWGSKTIYSFTNVFKSHHKCGHFGHTKQHCCNKSINYLKQYFFYKSHHNYESKHLKFPIFTVSFSDKLWSFSLSSFSCLLSNNKENGKESILGSGFHLGVLWLSKDLCFLSFIGLYHSLAFPLLFIHAASRDLVSLVHKITNWKKRGWNGLLCEKWKYKISIHEYCCPFTSEMFVKHEHGIVITMMHYFYF